MPYSETCHISLGTGKAGITDLRAQLVSSAGIDVGSEISGAVEINSGDYLMDITAIPDDLSGGIKIYQAAAPSVIIASGAVNSPVPNIHNALNTWAPDTETSPPPIVLPPDNPDVCRVYLWAKDQNPDDIPATLESAAAQIVDLPHTSGGQFFTGQQVSPIYDSATGLAWWDIVRGATVKVIIVSHGLAPLSVVVPDAATANVADLMQ